jgi:hypothetical protein
MAELARPLGPASSVFSTIQTEKGCKIDPTMKPPAALLIVLCGSIFARAQTVMKPADQPVILTGTIREIHGYGPPGYGEDKKADAHVTYLVIDLPKPINIACSPERPEWASEDCGAAKRLKLFFSTSRGVDPEKWERTAENLIGRKVSLTGVLHRADTVGEITPIYINVTAIESAGGT